MIVLFFFFFGYSHTNPNLKKNSEYPRGISPTIQRFSKIFFYYRACTNCRHKFKIPFENILEISLRVSLSTTKSCKHLQQFCQLLSCSYIITYVSRIIFHGFLQISFRNSPSIIQNMLYLWKFLNFSDLFF